MIAANPNPWGFLEAKTAARKASLAQAQAERDFSESVESYSRSERAYRVELAKEMLRLRVDGMAATLVPDLARGNERIATLKHERDLCKGLLDASTHALWRHTSDRKDLHRFIDWSMAASTGRAMD